MERELSIEISRAAGSQFRVQFVAQCGEERECFRDYTTEETREQILAYLHETYPLITVIRETGRY